MSSKVEQKDFIEGYYADATKTLENKDFSSWDTTRFLNMMTLMKHLLDNEPKNMDSHTVLFLCKGYMKYCHDNSVSFPWSDTLQDKDVRETFFNS